ncbi:hypothetical protein [Desulfatibacillum aliphaticivorans]|uniref:hypothetical protein n=1 Tax=Desulfatibacillum aliphaticivorans TaxID=218208 RepID=UPI00041149BC|nr:hypothetical protein [Desulfatibacillum aliphaticivorans]
MQIKTHEIVARPKDDALTLNTQPLKEAEISLEEVKPTIKVEYHFEEDNALVQAIIDPNLNIRVLSNHKWLGMLFFSRVFLGREGYGRSLFESIKERIVRDKDFESLVRRTVNPMPTVDEDEQAHELKEYDLLSQYVPTRKYPESISVYQISTNTYRRGVEVPPNSFDGANVEFIDGMISIFWVFRPEQDYIVQLQIWKNRNILVYSNDEIAGRNFFIRFLAFQGFPIHRSHLDIVDGWVEDDTIATDFENHIDAYKEAHDE